MRNGVLNLSVLRGKETGKCLVSHEWIYRWILTCKHSNKRQLKGIKTLYTLLKHGRRHRKRRNRKDNRGIIPGRISITERPPIVDKHTCLCNHEVDLMIGKDHKSALLVVLDRMTLQTRMRKLRGKNASFVKQADIQAFKKNHIRGKPSLSITIRLSVCIEI
jgi:transposase, IS30 family